MGEETPITEHDGLYMRQAIGWSRVARARGKAPARKAVPKRVHNPRKPHVSLAKLLSGGP